MTNYTFSDTTISLDELTKQHKVDIVMADALVMRPGWEKIPVAVKQLDFANLVGTDVLYESVGDGNESAELDSAITETAE